MLNKEEFEALKNNTHQIEGYLRSLMPEIRETIKVEFGDIVTRRGAYGCPVREREFCIVIDREHLVGRSGGLTYSFTDQISSSYYTYVYGKGYGSEFMLQLIRDWPLVKARINSAISTQRAKYNSIHSFIL